ncbi:MAG: hypothetical protein EZS28_021178 [Streblomastix strix]|uniref:Uncharacterized protein n=1 Tax=Streblomastix strix TaxID=222440 RepID=A0A5J4VLG1_9EUKA|nr:MAG: hypothetical protein EZS28_021178 [Streblomastix strix]
MQQRIQSKIEGNSGGEQFSKIAMNSSYGSDGMNQKHFSDIKLCDIHETFRKHLNGRFKSDRKLADNLYAVEFEQQKCNCKTCLQVAFAVLDCSKYCKSQAQILDELLKRFDKTKKQIEIAEDSMKLSIQTILKQPKRLNLTEFVDEIQIQNSDREIPVIIENADKIQYGGITIQDWFDDYIVKELQKDKKRQNIRLPQEQTTLQQTIKFPFKSKVKAYEQVHGVKLQEDKKQTVVPDYQIKQLPQKFGRPYFSYDIGSWEIDVQITRRY